MIRHEPPTIRRSVFAPGIDGTARDQDANLPLTSMIDVVFLLLIFFLLTSNLGAPERRLSTTLSVSGDSAVPNDLEPQVVRVRATPDGYSFEIGSHRLTSVDQLVRVLERLPTAQGLIVRADPEAPVSAVADALQAGVDAGFERRTYVPGG